jgi:hypothetical protein
MYDSDMAVGLAKNSKRAPDAKATLEANIALMKKWQAEGK